MDLMMTTRALSVAFGKKRRKILPLMWAHNALHCNWGIPNHTNNIQTSQSPKEQCQSIRSSDNDSTGLWPPGSLHTLDAGTFNKEIDFLCQWIKILCIEYILWGIPTIESTFDVANMVKNTTVKDVPIKNDTGLLNSCLGKLCLHPYLVVPLISARVTIISTRVSTHCQAILLEAVPHAHGRTCRQPSFPRWKWVPGVMFLTFPNFSLTPIWPGYPQLGCYQYLQPIVLDSLWRWLWSIAIN